LGTSRASRIDDAQVAQYKEVMKQVTLRPHVGCSDCRFHDSLTTWEWRHCDANIKRLELGTFEVPRYARVSGEDGATSPAGIEMRLSDLTLILEGIDLASVRRRPRWRRA
jgi:hypothetical protein